MRKDLAKDIYKYYRSGFRKLRNNDQENES